MRFLIAILTAVTVVFAIAARPIQVARHQQRIINRIAELGGTTSNGMPVDSEGFRWILPRLIYPNSAAPCLRQVNLSGSKVTDADLELIMQLDHIYRLDLSRTSITDAGMKSLGNSDWLQRLELQGTKVSDAGITHLANNQNLGYLDVVNTQVTHAGLAQLDETLPNKVFGEMFAARKLKLLGAQVVAFDRAQDFNLNGHSVMAELGCEVPDVILGMNRKLTVTSEMVKHVSHLTSLENLNIHDVTLEPDCLASLDGLPNLKVLEIYHTNLQDNDLKYISRLGSVEKLEIYGCKELTGANLLELTKLKNLSYLMIWECRGISKEKLEELSRLLPNCEKKFSHFP
ncbi:MAG: hypothetical protein AAF497_02885 [Planctomycetota bacterium]